MFLSRFLSERPFKKGHYVLFPFHLYEGLVLLACNNCLGPLQRWLPSGEPKKTLVTSILPIIRTLTLLLLQETKNSLFSLLVPDLFS